MLDNIMAQIQPAAHQLGATAQAQCERIVARLDRIVAAVESPQFDAQYRRFAYSIGAGSTNIGCPRQGFTWELQTLSVDADVAGVISLLVNGTFRCGVTLDANGLGTVIAPVAVLAGEPVTVVLETATIANLSLQFAERADPVKARRIAPQPPQLPADAGNENETSRHVGTPVFARTS